MDNNIKYKAWVKKEKRFCRVMMLQFHQKTGRYIGANLYPNFYLPKSHIELFMCWGKKDINGKWIYEGDIVRRINDEIGFVKFNGYSFEIDRGSWIRKYGDVSYMQYPSEYFEHYDGYELESTCKIIGNIKTNPNLLDNL